ncbi:MAG: ATP-binding protein [Burkholderiales bacterium]|nr:ATP-binding protein [Burkholderiales bacterium]
MEDIDTRADRGLDHRAVMSLALGDWIESGHSVLITGPTGAGKSWLGCALAQYACRRGHSARYQRVPRMGEELRMRHGNPQPRRVPRLAPSSTLSENRSKLLENRHPAGGTASGFVRIPP